MPGAPPSELIVTTTRAHIGTHIHVRLWPDRNHKTTDSLTSAQPSKARLGSIQLVSEVAHWKAMTSVHSATR